MNDILFGNNNTEVIKRLSKRYFKRNRIRNLAAILAIMLTAFLFTSITSLVFSMSSSIQLSMQMQKGSKADGDIRYLTEEQYEELQIPAFFIAVIYLILAAVIPVVVLHFFNKGSVVERLRTAQ